MSNPPEPGFGGVVKTTAGEEWSRGWTADGKGEWACLDRYAYADYCELDVSTVVSDGH